MGGTFDPIHYGHLVTAEEARVQFDLERVLFVPAGRPAHKMHADAASPEHRYRMAVIATASNRAFNASRTEVDREGTSYTIDTVRELRDELGSKGSNEICIRP